MSGAWPSRAHPVLCYQRGGESVQRRTITTDVVSVGSSPSRDIEVDAEGVAPAHLTFHQRGGQWFLVDHQSRAGTLVVPVHGEPELVLDRARPIAPGDQVLIGHPCSPRFRAWIEEPPAPGLPPSIADAAPSAGSRGLAAAVTAAVERGGRDEPLPLGEASLRAEVQQLRGAVADAVAERDAAVKERDVIAEELARARRDATRAEDLLQRRIAERDREITSLSRYLTEQAQELAGIDEQLQAEHRQQDELRHLAKSASASFDAAALESQHRAEVIETQSLDLEMARSQLEEQRQLVKNLTAALERLHKRVGGDR